MVALVLILAASACCLVNVQGELVTFDLSAADCSQANGGPYGFLPLPLSIPQAQEYGECVFVICDPQYSDTAGKRAFSCAETEETTARMKPGASTTVYWPPGCSNTTTSSMCLQDQRAYLCGPLSTSPAKCGPSYDDYKGTGSTPQGDDPNYSAAPFNFYVARDPHVFINVGQYLCMNIGEAKMDGFHYLYYQVKDFYIYLKHGATPQLGGRPAAITEVYIEKKPLWAVDCSVRATLTDRDTISVSQTGTCGSVTYDSGHLQLAHVESGVIILLVTVCAEAYHLNCFISDRYNIIYPPSPNAFSTNRGGVIWDSFERMDSLTDTNGNLELNLINPNETVDVRDTPLHLDNVCLSATVTNDLVCNPIPGWDQVVPGGDIDLYKKQ